MADLLKRVRPIGDGFVWRGNDWSSDGTRRIEEPHDGDIERMGSLSVSNLMKLCEALDAYYTITPSARRNTVSVNINAMEGFMKRDGARWVNIKPEFMWHTEAKEAKREAEEKPVGKRAAKKAEEEADFRRAVAEAPVGPPPQPKKLEVPAPVPEDEFGEVLGSEDEEIPADDFMTQTGIDTNRLSFDDREILEREEITFTRWKRYQRGWGEKEVIPDEGKPDRYYVAQGRADLEHYLWRAYGPNHDEIPWKFQGLILPDGSINTDVPAPIISLDWSDVEAAETSEETYLKNSYMRFLMMLSTAMNAPYNDRRDKILLNQKMEGYTKYVRDENRDMEKAGQYARSMEDAITWQETKENEAVKKQEEAMKNPVKPAGMLTPFQEFQKNNPRNRWGKSSHYGDYIAYKYADSPFKQLAQLRHYYQDEFRENWGTNVRPKDAWVIHKLDDWELEALSAEARKSKPEMIEVFDRGRVLLNSFWGDNQAEQ